MRALKFLVSFLLLVLLLSSCVKEKKNAAFAPVLDTLTYARQDYDAMRSETLADSMFMANLDRSIDEGTRDAIAFKKMLYMPYEERFSSGMAEEDLKLVMYHYFISRNSGKK
jgi:PBP1b-binding outer membrane lipoprotein LpoB